LLNDLLPLVLRHIWKIFLLRHHYSSSGILIVPTGPGPLALLLVIILLFLLFLGLILAYSTVLLPIRNDFVPAGIAAWVIFLLLDCLRGR
jgi:hypothetical protein